MCCNCCSVRQQKIWVFTIGSILTVLGSLLIPLWPTWSDQLVESMLPLAPNSFIYNRWVISPMPLYTSFYLYNWTNPEYINNPNVKPNFVEHGPYTFRDYKVKENLEWNSVNNTVTFFGRRTWTFEPSKSNGSLDDLITTPHLPSVVATKMVRTMHPILRKIMNFALNREGGAISMTHTAIEWLFDGFYDDILDFAERLHSPRIPLYTNNFAWFYGRNNSKEAEGTYTIHTGKGDLTQMGDLKMWNDSDHTTYWEGECGRINGSTGDLWAPGKKWDDPVSVFIYDAKRFINVFAKRIEMYRGVECRRYESTDQTFDSGHVAPDTKCFCVKGNECPKNGVIDYSPVAFRAPVYMSHPHFYMADVMYRENTTGLNPDAEKHGIHMLIEPKLGIPLHVKGQVLASIHVKKDDMMDLYRDTAYNFYAPLCGMVIEAELNDELLNVVKFVLNLPNIGRYIGIVLLVVGVIMLSLATYLTKTHKWRGDFYTGESVETPDEKSPEMETPKEESNENKNTF